MSTIELIAFYISSGEHLLFNETLEEFLERMRKKDS